MSFHSKWVLPPICRNPYVFLHPSKAIVMMLLHKETCFEGLFLQYSQLVVCGLYAYVYDGGPSPLPTNSAHLATESNSTTSCHDKLLLTIIKQYLLTNHSNVYNIHNHINNRDHARHILTHVIPFIF